jgi:hypothetical protein
MLAMNFAISSKMLIQHFAILHPYHVNHAPSGNAIAASPTNLPAEQPYNSILNAIIVRFDNAFVALISEPDQSLVFNRGVKHLVEFLIDSHFKTHCHFAASYFLALGGISDVSTGSNSNFGSSASGAKYAFVVFKKFLSSRSGKSGL